MYCIKCGVELAQSEASCPLCGTAVCHPQFPVTPEAGQYPPDQFPPRQVRPWGILAIVTFVFALPVFITLLCDIQLNRGITWSGYVTAGLLVAYVLLVLPHWFRKQNPVIFLPVNFAAIGLLLLYINWRTQGDWFLSFAFPITGGLGLLVTTVAALTRYIRRGRLYIFGGAALALGAFMPVMEMLLNLTFHRGPALRWSLYPLTVLVLLGALLLVTAICRPLRESFEKHLFL